jgi:hypothetical protein
MSYRTAIVTKATIIVWRKPEPGDLPPFLALLKETRMRFRGPTAFISISPPDIIPPGTDFLSAVRPLMDEILVLAPHAAVVIEGGGLAQAFVRTFHSMLFTMTRKNIGVFKALPDALGRLAPALGLDLGTWISEIRSAPLLGTRVSEWQPRESRRAS